MEAVPLYLPNRDFALIRRKSDTRGPSLHTHRHAPTKERPCELTGRRGKRTLTKN